MLNLFAYTNSNHMSIYKKVLQRLIDKFYQDSFAEIRIQNSKLRTYSILKTERGIVEYLFNVKNLKQRILLSKLRLSDHNLMIESGRHRKIVKENRLCPFCPKAIEDEIHFMLDCPCYTNLRNETWHQAVRDVPGFTRFNPQEKFKFVLTENYSIITVSKFIEMAFSLRAFLINKPKR